MTQTRSTIGNLVATTGPDVRSFAMPSAGSRKNASLAKSIRDAIDDALLFYRCEDGVRWREHKTASDGYRFPLHERIVELFRRRLSIDAVINYFLCFFLDPFFFLATLDPFLGASSSINGLCAMNAGLLAPTNDSFGVWSGGIFDPMAV